jgi:septum formation protein
MGSRSPSTSSTDRIPTSPPSARSGSGSAESIAAPRLTLASASPRRREILERLGVAFDLVAPEVEEISDGEPERVVLENARRKAAAGHAVARLPGPVLAVDTDVALDGRLLGKPADVRAARARLEALSGRAHEVVSGVVVLDPSGAPAERSAVARTEVRFRALDTATLKLYLGSGEWQGRAGAYAIQGLGSILIESIRGDFSNVVGLPVPTLLDLLPSLLAE